MSYRAFKRLLGETSLERKCRFLFGAATLVLVISALWIHLLLTEGLAYEQAKTTCRVLVNPILAQQHLPHLQAKHNKKLEGKDLQVALNLADYLVLKEQGKEYQYRLLTDQRFDEMDSYERELYKEFRRSEDKAEDTRPRPSEQALLFYAPIRLSKACLSCHQTLAQEKGVTLADNEIVGMLSIRMPTKAIEEGVHFNRAIMMANGLGIALCIMAGGWIIVRYVIVKPVKHLKEVSDAISAGELNVRSEIQTGDEFEDLSHAFNRMLRNLVSMQDQWRKVNADLDPKGDELAQANMALFESNRLKSDFLATMSHELRTPLNSILGFSDVLIGDQLNDKQQRWVSNIKSSGERLLALINDILDLAKIEAGKMQVRVGEFSLYDICEGMLTMFRPLAEKKNIDLRGQFELGIPPLRQ